MQIKNWIKKSASMFCTGIILFNAGMPIFAYSKMEPDKCSLVANEDIHVCVSEKSSGDELMEIDLGEQKISAHLIGKNIKKSDSNDISPSHELDKNQTVQLSGVLEDVSVRYKKQEQELKEDFILHSKNAENSFVLKYNVGNLRAKQVNTQDILLLDENNQTKMLISAPCMTDASGVCSQAVSLEIVELKNGILSARLTADSSWLQDSKRTYPVEVDPLYSIPKNTLRKGDSNKDVAVLKSMLLEARFGAGIPMHDVENDMKSELFGPITERFVLTFQRKVGLRPTGVADVNTLNALARHLEKMKILDTQVHIDQFLSRVAQRSSSATGEEVKGVASFFRRINFTDMAVTLGITGVATAIGAVCLPLIGIAGVVAGCAAVGAVVGGASEVAQQKSAGDSVDGGRVVIKALGGAVKGGVAAIPGVNICNAFRPAVTAAGQVVGPALSQAVGGAVGKAAVVAAKSALTPALVGQAVGAAGGVLVSAAATNTAVAAGTTLAVGAVEDFGCAVKSGKPAQDAAKDAALNGVCQAATVPVAAAVVVGGAACGAAYIAYKEGKPKLKDDVDSELKISTKMVINTESSKTVVPKPTVSPKNSAQTSPVVPSTDTHAESSSSSLPPKKVIPSRFPQEETGVSKKEEGSCAETPKTSEVSSDSRAPTQPEKPLLQIIDETLHKTVRDTQAIGMRDPTPRGFERQIEKYRQNLKFVSETRESVEKGERKLTPDEERKLEMLEFTAHTEIQKREQAQKGDPKLQKRLRDETRMDPRQIIAEQIRLYDEMIGRQFFDGLARMYS